MDLFGEVLSAADKIFEAWLTNTATLRTLRALYFKPFIAVLHNTSHSHEPDLTVDLPLDWAIISARQ
jgi:hypothetical protein